MAVKLGYKNVFRDPLGFPQWHAKRFPVESKKSGLDNLDQAGSSSAGAKPNGVGPLHGWAMVWTLMGIFVGGIALNLTPCVYPLIPITISYFGGKSDKGSIAIHGGCYVAGIAFTNSILGVFAALTGSLMGALLQHPIVLTLLSILLISLSASLFGFWELKVPFRVMQAATRSHSGYVGSLFMGLMMGIVAAPCIGPFVLGLLTWVASMGSPWLGFVIFFTLSLGLGLPFFFLALFSGHINKLPRSGEWMLWVRKLMGWVLIGMAAYFIQPLVPETVGVFSMAGVGLFAGIHLGWMDRTKAAFKAFDWIKMTAALAALVFAIVLIGNYTTRGPQARFDTYSDSLLAEARNAGKPVIIDFSAQWCTPCRELDDVTFHDANVVDRVEKEFTLVKVDLTRKGNPVHERLLAQYKVKGVPTVVFLDRQGNEIQSLRLVDFEPPEKFLERMKKAEENQ